VSQWQPVEFRGVRVGTRDVPHGREKDGRADDPYELVGVRFPAPEGIDADRELARIFVEEYALIGWSPTRIRELFASPVFAGAHDLVRRRGQGLVEDAIVTVFGSHHDEESI